LINSPPLAQHRNTPHYDADLAELVAKLVNNIVHDVIVILDSSANEAQTKQQADEILQAFVPYLLRFFADEYDEVCSTVIDAITDLLTYFRKLVKAQNTLPHQYSAMLPSTLEAIIAKMKYDETASWGWEDGGFETDEAEFQELRKKLNGLQQIVMACNEQLYMDTLSRIVGGTLDKLGSGQTQVDWRELDLALHEMYLFGDLAAKNRGIYQKRQPSSVAAELLIKMVVKMLQAGMCITIVRELNEFANIYRRWIISTSGYSPTVYGAMRQIRSDI
jgi:exportin-T